jgi:hypothetical protein
LKQDQWLTLTLESWVMGSPASNHPATLQDLMAIGYSTFPSQSVSTIHTAPLLGCFYGINSLTTLCDPMAHDISALLHEVSPPSFYALSYVHLDVDFDDPDLTPQYRSNGTVAPSRALFL